MNAFSDWGLGAVGDPEVFSKLSAAQQGWVAGGLAGVKAAAFATDKAAQWPNPGSTLVVGPSSQTMGFQWWSNDATKTTLRTDGVFDQDTLNTLQMFVAQLGGSPFPPAGGPGPIPGPGGTCPAGQAPDPKTGLCATTTKPGLSTGAVVGIAAAGAVAVGGVLYVLMHHKKRR